MYYFKICILQIFQPVEQIVTELKFRKYIFSYTEKPYVTFYISYINVLIKFLIKLKDKTTI